MCPAKAQLCKPGIEHSIEVINMWLLKCGSEQYLLESIDLVFKIVDKHRISDFSVQFIEVVGVW